MMILNQIAVKIIKEQELIIGPIAWIQAAKVQGMHVIDAKTGELSLDNENDTTTIDNLVSQYEHLFGRASREVCKEAVSSLLSQLSPDQVPQSLQ